MSLSKHEKTFQDSFALKGTFLLVGAERGLKAMRMGEGRGESHSAGAATSSAC